MKRRPTDTHLRDALLVALTVAWGSIDAIGLGALGRVYSAFQTGNVILIGFLVFWIVVDGRPSSTSADFFVAISALGAGMETGAIFRLGIRAVFTTAATATVTAFMSDVDDDLTQQRNAAVDQARLPAVIVAACAGACAGAALLVNVRDIAPIVAPALTLGVAAIGWVAFVVPARSVAGQSPRGDAAPAT